MERVAGGEGQRVVRGTFGDAALEAVWSEDKNPKKRAKKLLGR